MKLGGEILSELFKTGTWRAYRGDDLLSWSSIEPLIGPNSIDVTLGSSFLVPAENDTPVDPRDEKSLEWAKVDITEGDSIVLYPGAFMLGSVRERFVCEEPARVEGGETGVDLTAFTVSGFPPPQQLVHKQALFAPMYEGRSSCGRIGLASHITAGFGDYGFGGCFTLELFNHFPRALILYPGMRIGQVAFDEVERPKKYQGAYSGENHNWGPVPPKLGPTRF